ncbi:porin family protein [Bradyrhizobium diazoefficiens]|nr:outer membrane beta-barrel protein [Bradyrhizobium diazoefficiens]MBR0852123.1 porin family protein [Bradyrhizobium diazoefficiens]
MRGLWLVAAVLGAASAAQAADMPDLPVLRGGFTDGLSKTSHNWDGFYVGGQAGFATSNIDFSHAPKSMTDFMLRDSVLQAPVGGWSLLPRNHVQSTGFGAFVGRNWQYYDAVLGVEANYSYMNSLSSSASDSMSRLLAPADSTVPKGHIYSYDTTLGGGASLKLKDYATFRGRVGWDGGEFMPYAFGGLAVGRAEVSRFASVAWQAWDDWDETQGLLTVHHHDPLPARSQTTPLTQAEQRTNSFMYGWTAGIGIEYALWQCIFLRGEWEHVGFSKVKDISVSLDNFRLGAGYKF